MEITEVKFESYRWPRAKPIRNGRYTYHTAGLDLVKVETVDGVVGTGLCQAVQDAPNIGQAILEHMKQFVIGQDPFDNERIWDCLLYTSPSPRD